MLIAGQMPKREVKAGEFCRHCFPESKKKPACGLMNEGWICTRPKGHGGKHVACGQSAHVIHVWGGQVKLVEIKCGKRAITRRK